MTRLFIIIGSAFGLLGVAAGAFGAHGLRSILSPEMLAIFETAVRYQMIHALALLAAAWLAHAAPGRAIHAAGGCFIAGILIFSGSLYLLTLSGVRAWGAVTPIGGIAFLAGWALMGWHGAKRVPR
ncbi:MAG: hypothetical protein BWZ08_01563 [candidate division BRC1 bacterium ADurb.BinA292]|nr:MAG: hypothetical protein BWZ08_01563 [candidate division BRC1 bacterium ADurb.BinA292]